MSLGVHVGGVIVGLGFLDVDHLVFIGLLSLGSISEIIIRNNQITKHEYPLGYGVLDDMTLCMFTSTGRIPTFFCIPERSSTYVFIYVCAHIMYILCMYVCLYVCMYVCTYACIYVRRYLLCMYIFMSECLCVCVEA